MKASQPSCQPERSVLRNDVRVFTERLDRVDSVSLGVWVARGSRHDPPEMEGLAHLLEHMLFKGTTTRSAIEIGEAIDDIGGHVNAFTDREFLYLHAQTVAEEMEAGLELLFDLLLNSVCTEEEFEREKQVVAQEIGHLEDAPEGLVHELLPEIAWAGHALGRSALGTRRGLAAMERESLLRHLSEFRASDRIIVTAAGRVDHDRVVGVVERAAGDMKPGPPALEAEPPAFHGEHRLIPSPAGQVHFCLATPGCARTDPRRQVFAVLDTMLGGGSSSRLFQQIREKRGLAYSIGSYLQSYRDAGLLVIDAGIAMENLQLVLDLVTREIENLRTSGPSEQELARAKTQLKVAIALAAESTSFRMQHLAGSEMYWGRLLSFDEIIAGVEKVSAEDVVELAHTVFTEERRALVAVGPFDQ